MLVLAIAALGCAAPVAAQAPFIPFQAKDAGKSGGQGTVATCVNQSGTVAGRYADSNYVTHGFVRSPSGQITEFNGTGNQSITVTGINISGKIMGNTQGVFLPRFTDSPTHSCAIPMVDSFRSTLRALFRLLPAASTTVEKLWAPTPTSDVPTKASCEPQMAATLSSTNPMPSPA